MKYIKKIYNATLRPYLPKKIAILNGVGVRYVALFDTNDVHPNYKHGMGRLIREHVTSIDTVVEIGGGRGVLSIVAARAGATVHTYEAAEEMVQLLSETVENNPTIGNVQIHHKLVEANKNVFGNKENAEHISTSDLPTHDVLIMDCEGAETAILGGYNHDARVMIIESHPNQDASVKRLETILNNVGYEIDMTVPSSPSSQKSILVAVQKDNHAHLDT